MANDRDIINVLRNMSDVVQELAKRADIDDEEFWLKLQAVEDQANRLRSSDDEAARS
jgi:predicted CoA-binding protein